MRDHLLAAMRPSLIFLAGAAVGAAWMLGFILLDLDLEATLTKEDS